MYKKSLYQERLSNGLCGVCGKNPRYEKRSNARPNAQKNKGPMTVCESCFKNNNRYKEIDPTQLNKSPNSNKLDKSSTFAKLACIEAYGGKCTCCSITDPTLLELDHINNDGKTHRAETKTTGTSFYWLLIRQKFPKGLQVLCCNCHRAKTHYNGCKSHPYMVL